MQLFGLRRPGPLGRSVSPGWSPWASLAVETAPTSGPVTKPRLARTSAVGTRSVRKKITGFIIIMIIIIVIIIIIIIIIIIKTIILMLVYW